MLKISDRRLRGLIVEDEGLTLLLLIRVLAAAGYELAGTAVNGEEAIEVARRAQPDFILMDTNMPVMNGVEATRRIIAERPLPIIMLTGYSAEENVNAALEAGACAYVVKPVTSSELIIAVREAIEAFEKAL